jgi:hypothetical protein
MVNYCTPFDPMVGWDQSLLLCLQPLPLPLESRCRPAALEQPQPMSLALAALNAMDRHAFLAALGDIAGYYQVAKSGSGTVVLVSKILEVPFF